MSSPLESTARSVVLEAYRRYHDPSYISPDPLEIVLEYPEPDDREVAALICASLALGRVRSVLAACREVLGRIPGPPGSLREMDLPRLEECFDGFVYRFFGREEMAHFLCAIGRTLRTYGSLQAAFRSHLAPGDSTVLSALAGFSRELSREASGIHGLLLAQVERGSASKRWHLFLRWMVRRDDVDPGGWDGVPPSALLVPMDTHMHRLCKELGILRRKSADEKAAVEATEFFRAMAPQDPARFDFSLTRMGIHDRARAESRLWLPSSSPGVTTPRHR